MTVQTFAIYLLKTGISDSYIRIMDFFLKFIQYLIVLCVSIPLCILPDLHEHVPY